MEEQKIKNLYKHISNFHKNEDFGNIELNLEGKLNPTLRQYQDRAVKWMLKKELNEDLLCINGSTLLLPRGGILADEMGLGKTVEALACILSNVSTAEEARLRRVHWKKRSDIVGNSSDEEDDEPLQKRLKTLNSKREPRKRPAAGTTYSLLKKQYEAALMEMSCTRTSRCSESHESTRNPIQCFCDDNESNNKKLVKCEVCGIWQHAECLGIENGYTFGSVKCPHCWCKSEVVQGRGTLIITPPSILDQWIKEIEKHVSSPDFKYIVYRGVKNHHYVQPPTLAGYDVVLTTYTVLCSEIDFLQGENSRSLRHAKKYYSPSSPLVCINWWRVCLDEAQMVEGFTSKTASMAKQINAQQRWAVTGTPIQKSVHDLYGLLVFLQLKELDQEILSETDQLFSLMERLMWRSSKEDVHLELGVPPQTVLTHWLHFSPVEGHFYRTIHTESAKAFYSKLNRFPDLDVRLEDIDKKILGRLMLPLLGVRQACTHPQVVRGKFVRFKHTMTMEDLMKQMIVKAKNDADCAMRQVVSALHGMAGISVILFDWADAVEKYRKVLELGNQYLPDVKVDTLQMIHCLHNLAEVLENHGAGIPPTLRDSQLREQAKELENNYLLRYEKKLEQTRATLSKITANIAHQCKGLTLGYTGWWEKLIMDYDFDEEDLLHRIKTYLNDDTEVPGQQSISKKLKKMYSVYTEVSTWLGDADSLREETKAEMRRIEVLPWSELIQSAFVCHIENKKKKKKIKGTCPLCVTEGILKKYEAHIFSINKLNLNAFSSEDEENEEDGKETKALKAVEIYKTNKESSWKPTSHERIIHVLANYAKRIDPKLAEEGAQHLAILESVRKEFKWIRAVWRNISDQVYATDELYMAKLRLRLPLYEGEEKNNDVFIIAEHDVALTLLQQTSDYSQGEALLQRTTGTLFYLMNLQKTGTTEQDCPVCKETLTNKWSVLVCGHCCCYNCIPFLLKMNSKVIDCPLCRLKTPKDQISYVQAQKDSSDLNEPNIIGDHSTKVTAIVSKLVLLMAEDPQVKVLIFSSWEKVLDIIRDALQQNNISFRRLESGGNKFKTQLTQFKTGTVTALLLPLKHGSKGLNLIEATHIFFVEPLLNPGEEQQAVGRIHRIGQTKDTFVHRFIVANTIEERMLSSLDTPEEWTKENLTLRRLNDLFLLKEENMEV